MTTPHNSPTPLTDAIQNHFGDDEAYTGWTAFGAMAQHARQLERSLAEKTKESEERNKSYLIIKDQARRHFELLQTLLEEFDHYADGAPDATALGKFCNDMIGKYNNMSLNEARTLKGQNNSLKSLCGEMLKALSQCKGGFEYLEGRINCTAYLRTIEQAISLAKEQGIGG